MEGVEKRRALSLFQEAARGCKSCHAAELIHVHERHGPARPMLQQSPTGHLGVLVVGEAPNWDDTFNPAKGYLTYDADTDPTGSFMRQLLVEEVGLSDEEIKDVLFTNAVLCLPKLKGEKYPVSIKQLDLCQSWLVRLIQNGDVKVVVTMGAMPLQALARIERHGLTLRAGVGKLHPWFGRQLLPLYHAGLLGRISRPATLQRADIRALRSFLGR